MSMASKGIATAPDAMFLVSEAMSIASKAMSTAPKTSAIAEKTSATAEKAGVDVRTTGATQEQTAAVLETTGATETKTVLTATETVQTAKQTPFAITHAWGASLHALKRCVRARVAHGAAVGSAGVAGGADASFSSRCSAFHFIAIRIRLRPPGWS